ncbi:MAG TPA: DUF1385 domain-containing protein [Candidatus Limnocylindria bacterium]|nr:DUF1385 domain-containing protein [Candidatus Limnocylindria bacterium]
MSQEALPRYGGQALVEGVMIRGRTSWAVALRHRDGSIVGESGLLPEATGWRQLPVLRGMAILGSQLTMGWRLLSLSSVVKMYGDRRPMPRHVTLTSVLIALTISIGAFVVLPMLATERSPDSGPLVRLAEGALKFGALVAYIAFVSRLPSVRRVFSFHGAEHMAIHAHEHGRPLTVEQAAGFSPAHPRCGTAFLVILALTDTLILALLPRFGLVPDLTLRILGLPLLAGVAYELLRFGAYRPGAAGVLNRIGMLSQKVTTAQPTEDQLEVALSALQLVLRAEGRPLPAGSREYIVQPIPEIAPQLRPLPAP